jgi:hypothetical protein
MSNHAKIRDKASNLIGRTYLEKYKLIMLKK